MNEAPALLDAPTAPVHTLEPIERQFTPDEIKEGKLQAVELMKTNVEINYIAQTLCYSRQLYSMMRVMLQDRLRKAGASDCTEEAIVQAMSGMAEKPFDSKELLDKIKLHVIPMVLAENVRLEDEENKAEKQVELSAEDRRKSQLMPIGFEFRGDNRYLKRDRTLTFVGHPNAIRYVMDQIVNTALVKPELSQQTANVVLRLVTALLPQIANAKRDKPYVAVGANQWINSAVSFKKLGTSLQPWLRQLRSNRVDLFVVDDIAQSVNGAPGRTTAMLAAETHRLFRKWANEQGAALLIGVPTEELVPQIDVNALGWRELEEHTILRTIEVVPALGTAVDTQYRLLIDGRQAFIVDKAIIDGR